MSDNAYSHCVTMLHCTGCNESWEGPATMVGALCGKGRVVSLASSISVVVPTWGDDACVLCGDDPGIVRWFDFGRRMVLCQKCVAH